MMRQMKISLGLMDWAARTPASLEDDSRSTSFYPVNHCAGNGILVALIALLGWGVGTACGAQAAFIHGGAELTSGNNPDSVLVVEGGVPTHPAGYIDPSSGRYLVEAMVTGSMQLRFVDYDSPSYDTLATIDVPDLRSGIMATYNLPGIGFRQIPSNQLLNVSIHQADVLPENPAIIRWPISTNRTIWGQLTPTPGPTIDSVYAASLHSDEVPTGGVKLFFLRDDPVRTDSCFGDSTVLVPLSNRFGDIMPLQDGGLADSIWSGVVDAYLLGRVPKPSDTRAGRFLINGRSTDTVAANEPFSLDARIINDIGLTTAASCSLKVVSPAGDTTMGPMGVLILAPLDSASFTSRDSLSQAGTYTLMAHMYSQGDGNPGNNQSVSLVVYCSGIGITEHEVPLTAFGSRLTSPTIVRGVLFLPETSSPKPRASSCLLDVSGRKVLELHTGANDVSKMNPGVYFVSERISGGKSRAESCSVLKVILAK
jgi:hypothetical protein